MTRLRYRWKTPLSSPPIAVGRRLSLGRSAALLWSLIAGASCAPAIDSGCPPQLDDAVGAAGISCTLVASGELISENENPNIHYRLFRWIDGSDPPTAEGSIYDAPPYHQTAVIAETMSTTPEVVGFNWFWLGSGWFETPQIVANATHGEFLILPGRLTGTGSFVDDMVFVGAQATWRRVGSTESHREDSPHWIAELGNMLPADHYIAKGIRFDYATLTGETAVWRRDDANCCPSGGTVRFELKLSDPALGFELADATHTP